MSELNKIALKIISNGKGILAADESIGTMTKRLEAVNITSTPNSRLTFREILFSSDCIKKCVMELFYMMRQLIKYQAMAKKLVK